MSIYGAIIMPAIPASWLDANGEYSPIAHAASLSDTALANSLANAPESAKGSPLHAALVAEQAKRAGMGA